MVDTCLGKKIYFSNLALCQEKTLVNSIEVPLCEAPIASDNCFLSHLFPLSFHYLRMAEITSRIFSQSPPRKMTFTTEGYNRLKQETKHQLDIRLSVKSLGWRPEFSPKEVPLNLTSVVNTTSSSNILEKVRLALFLGSTTLLEFQCILNVLMAKPCRNQATQLQCCLQ